MPDPTPAPVSTPAAPAIAKPGAFAPQVSDVTPKQNVVHRVIIPQAQLATFAAMVDAEAPAGKSIRQLNAMMQENNLVLTIAYNS